MNTIVKSGFLAVVVEDYSVATRPSLVTVQGDEIRIQSVQGWQPGPEGPRWLLVYEGPELAEGERLYSADEDEQRKADLAARDERLAAEQAAKEEAARLEAATDGEAPGLASDASSLEPAESV